MSSINTVTFSGNITRDAEEGSNVAQAADSEVVAASAEVRPASLSELLRPLKVPFAAMGAAAALMLAACLVFPDFGRFMTEAGRFYLDTTQAAHDALMGFLLLALG